MIKLRLLLTSAAFTTIGLAIAQIPLNPSGKLVAAESQPVTLRFQAKVGSQPFRCGESYSLGTPAKMVTPTDFRFYVTDVALIDASGRAVPVTLQQDGKWQYQSVALLDFEDKSAACSNGTLEMRDRVIGTVPPGTYRGIQFSLGVPFALNHADSTLAASPLNLTSLWWNWRGGYKFLRIDLATAAMPHGAGTRQLTAHTPGSGHAGTGQSSTPGHGQPGAGHSPGGGNHQAQGFAIHLGSTACQASATNQPPTRCANPNLAAVTLNNFDPTRNVVVADLAALVQSTNLSMNQPNTPAGCMAGPEDNDCKGILHNVGLTFGGQPSTGQTFFRVE